MHMHGLFGKCFLNVDGHQDNRVDYKENED